MLNYIKKHFNHVKNRFKENTFDGLLWIVNIVPTLVGFDLKKDKISVLAPFWIIHLPLLIYVYGVGSVIYQVKYARDAGDFIASFVNVTLLVLTANNSYWFLVKRPLLKSILACAEENERLSHTSFDIQKKREKMLSSVKVIVFIFYGCNYINASLVYLPHRVDILNNYSMQPCVGLEPLTSSPNREICLMMLCAEEFSIMAVVLNYQALWLILIAHTATMYRLLSEELTILASSGLSIKEQLPLLIHRHYLILNILGKLQDIYSAPIGVNYGVNAVCMGLFCFLPLTEWYKFMPIIVYCFLVFFLNCYLCQRLINASEEFERAVYSCGWEDFHLNEKKMVYEMLLCAQKPVQLLAADIIPVNIATFAATMQTIYKFTTVFKL